MRILLVEDDKLIGDGIKTGLGKMGFIGGNAGVGLRLNAIEMAAYFPQIPARMWELGIFSPRQAARILTYPFINGSLTHALFVIVFTLALGKMVAEQFRPWALLALFFGAAIGGAVIYTAFGLLAGVDLAGAVVALDGFPVHAPACWWLGLWLRHGHPLVCCPWPTTWPTSAKPVHWPPPWKA